LSVKSYGPLRSISGQHRNARHTTLKANVGLSDPQLELAKYPFREFPI